jgi:hypothetical protein
MKKEKNIHDTTDSNIKAPNQTSLVGHEDKSKSLIRHMIDQTKVDNCNVSNWKY